MFSYANCNINMERSGVRDVLYCFGSSILYYFLDCELYKEAQSKRVVVAWLSGSALVSINEVTLRWARLVLG